MIIFDTYFVAIAMFELGLFNEDDKSIKLAEVFNVHCDFCSTHFRYGMIVSANEDIHWQGFD